MFLLSAAALLAGALTSGNPLQPEGTTGLSVENFVPAEIESRYRAEPCKVDTGDSCTFWVAGEDEPRYMIFRTTAKNANFWRNPQGALIARAVAPESAGAALRIRAIPKHAASDPATFAVSGKGFTGRAQVVAFKEEAVLVWMPDSPAGAGFVTVDVATVEAPTPQEIAEVRLSNQPDVISESSDGFLWFSAWGNEIYRIDPKTDIPEPMTGATATGTPDG